MRRKSWVIQMKYRAIIVGASGAITFANGQSVEEANLDKLLQEGWVIEHTYPVGQQSQVLLVIIKLPDGDC